MIKYSFSDSNNFGDLIQWKLTKVNTDKIQSHIKTILEKLRDEYLFDKTVLVEDFALILFKYDVTIHSQLAVREIEKHLKETDPNFSDLSFHITDKDYLESGQGNLCFRFKAKKDD